MAVITKGRIRTAKRFYRRFGCVWRQKLREKLKCALVKVGNVVIKNRGGELSSSIEIKIMIQFPKTAILIFF